MRENENTEIFALERLSALLRERLFPLAAKVETTHGEDWSELLASASDDFGFLDMSARREATGLVRVLIEFGLRGLDSEMVRMAYLDAYWYEGGGQIAGLESCALAPVARRSAAPLDSARAVWAALEMDYLGLPTVHEDIALSLSTPYAR